MAHTTIDTTEIKIHERTIGLCETQAKYINQGIAKGLVDMEAGRVLSDPDEIEKDIQQRFEEKKRAYLASHQ